MRAPFEADAAHAEWQLTLPAGAPVRVLSDLGDGWSECECAVSGATGSVPTAYLTLAVVSDFGASANAGVAARSAAHRMTATLDASANRDDVPSDATPATAAVPAATASTTAAAHRTSLIEASLPMGRLRVKFENVDGGVGVRSVDPESPCVGLLFAGDAVQTLNGSKVESGEALVKMLVALGNQSRVLVVQRADTQTFAQFDADFLR